MKTADPLRKTSVSLPEPNIWQKTYQVRSYEVDCHHRLSVLAIFNFMQEAASRHAEALGVSIQHLLSENYTWLLSRLKIRIASFPQWKDQIRISTWPSGSRRLFALRDFEFRDKDNLIVAAAVSAWLVLDVQKRRPVRIGPFVDRLKPLEGDHVLPDTLDKLPGLEGRTHEKKFVVRHRDLDINQHVNNVSFVEWLVESIPARILNAAELAELEINFLAEAFYEDHILAVCHPQDSHNTSFYHSLTRPQDGQELVRARTVWRKFD
jgi:medium-chain acyl-[acyl-carrier-protein] hydrolase